MSEKPAEKKKPKLKLESVWREAKTLVWQQRRRLGWALLLMLIGRLAGLVLPASSKYLIDDVLGKGDRSLLLPLAIAAGIATLVQAATGWGLANLLGIAAQRQIADMRKRLHAHVMRLPTSFFDGTKSGELITRVMADAEGIRNNRKHRHHGDRRQKARHHEFLDWIRPQRPHRVDLLRHQHRT